MLFQRAFSGSFWQLWRQKTKISQSEFSRNDWHQGRTTGASGVQMTTATSRHNLKLRSYRREQRSFYGRQMKTLLLWIVASKYLKHIKILMDFVCFQLWEKSWEKWSVNFPVGLCSFSLLSHIIHPQTAVTQLKNTCTPLFQQSSSVGQRKEMSDSRIFFLCWSLN